MTDPDLSRTLRRMAEEYSAEVMSEIFGSAYEDEVVAKGVKFRLEQFAHAVASAVRQELEPYLQHKADCASMPCQGHYDGTVCTSECQRGDGPCSCGLEAVGTQ